MADPENAFLIFFIIDVFSGYFLLEIYPNGVYNKPVLIRKIEIIKKKEVDRIDGKRENYSGTGRILLLLS